jgi:hypothetical protein
MGLKRASRGDEANGTRFITVYKPFVRAINKPNNVFTRSKINYLLMNFILIFKFIVGDKQKNVASITVCIYIKKIRFLISFYF